MKQVWMVFGWGFNAVGAGLFFLIALEIFGYGVHGLYQDVERYKQGDDVWFNIVFFAVLWFLAKMMVTPAVHKWVFRKKDAKNFSMN